MKQLRIYLSSTFEDLKEYRGAVFSALEKAGLAVARMEGYTAADERPLELCLRDVAQSDIYVGLFAWRYGYVPPNVHGNADGKSITELEYRHAETLPLRKLLFFTHSDVKAGWPDKFKDELSGAGDQGQRIKRLRQELGTEKMAAFFRKPDDLATEVLAAIMRTGVSGRPYNVPRPPPKFVGRPDLTKALIDSLTGSGGPSANTILHGPPGFGKTSLALDACHRPEVINAFPNGILWASLGTKPDVARALADLYTSATGEQPIVIGTDALRQALAKALGGRDYLVVIDDAWRGDDIVDFARLDGARLLVCTRARNLVEQAGEVAWPELSVDEMTSEQAGALLTRGSAVSGSVPAVVERLADQLGRWPLLLELANARLIEEMKRGRGDLVECAEWLTEHFRRRGVLVLDRRNSKARNAAVASSVGAGLEFAEESHVGVAQKAAEIAIFPEDTAVPVSTLATLWKIDPDDVGEEVLRPLDNLAIVQWDRHTGEVRLHDVIRLVLAARLAKPADVHARLITAWGDLRRLPDKYAWRWVAYHLLEADPNQLRTMLLDFNWLQAKVAALGLGSLVADYDTLPDDAELRLVQKALQLSGDVIAEDPGQLAVQLHGRLLHKDTSGIKGLLASAVSGRGGMWLRPLSASLTRAGGPLIRTLRGHTSIVLDASVTPDGRRVVSGSADNSLIVWALASGEVERVLLGHSNYVRSVVVTPDGRRVVSGSLDATVRVWELEDGREVLVFRGHTGPIEALAITPDSKRAVSASDDGTLKVWDLVSGVQCCTLVGHSSGVTDVKVTGDGRCAVSASKDCTLRVWDLEVGIERHTLGTQDWHTGQTLTLPDGRVAMYAQADGVLELWDVDQRRTLQTFAGHVDAIYSVALTPDGRRAVSASRDRTLRVWDLESGAELHTLRGHSNQAAVVVVTSDGRRAISGSFDKTVRVWDLETGASLATMAGHAFDVFFVAEIHGGRRVLSASSDSTIKVWDIDTGTELGTLRAHTEQIRALVLTPDSHRAISASNDGTLRVWDLDVVSDPHQGDGHISSVNAVAVTADGRLAVTAAGAQSGIRERDNTVKMWGVETAVELATLGRHDDYAWSVAVSRDGRRAVSGGGDGDLKVWDLEAGIEVARLRGHTEVVWDVEIARNGVTAVSASSDGTLIVWDLDCSTRRYTLTGHADSVNRVALSPDDRIAVSTSNDGTLKAWDFEAGRELRTFHGHTSGSFAIAFTPDGSRVVSGGLDNTLRVWRVATGDELFTLSGHSAVVTDVAVSSDSRFAISASGSGDGTLRVWDLSTGALLRILRGHTAYVTAVAIIENVRAVSSSYDRTVRLWDLTSGAMLAIYTGESEIRSLAVTSGGIVVAGEQSGRVHFLRIEQP